MQMKTCTFVDFIKMIEPWLDRDYIRKGYLDKNGKFRIFFTDGGEKNYRIDDCTEARLKEVLEMMLAQGIPVERGA
jgi:hypothetical protein